MIMKIFNLNLYELEQIDADAVIEEITYIMRKNKKLGDSQDTITIGGKRYKKTTADKAGWL